jgi:hypothetical protein
VNLRSLTRRSFVRLRGLKARPRRLRRLRYGSSRCASLGMTTFHATNALIRFRRDDQLVALKRNTFDVPPEVALSRVLPHLFSELVVHRFVE